MCLVVINLLSLLVLAASSSDLPSYFPKCKLDDPDLNKCIATAAHALRPFVRKGISEIDFPSMTPLVISRLTATQQSDMVNYTIDVWNYTIHGLDKYDLTEVRYDPETKSFDGGIALDTVFLDADYILNGMLLSIPVNGKGKIHIKFDYIDGKYEIKGKLANRKGTEYYQPTHTKIRMTVKNAFYHLGGLFDGNAELERKTNEILNLNSKILTNAVIPAFEKEAEDGLMYLMKALTKSIPYNNLFIVNPKEAELE